MITGRELRDGSPNREPTAQAVLRLLSDDALTAHERRALAALVAVVGEVDHELVSPCLSAAYKIAIEALSLT